MQLAPGVRLGPYEILSALGAGGMGEVWKAKDTRLNRLVAIKASHTPFSDRFEREAHAIAAVNHPNVCSLYDIGPDYLVMEYVEGVSPHGPVALARALTVADQILDALDAAHQQGIVHRDLKPGNILLTKSGVKVLDFGLAKVQSAPADGTSQLETRALLTTEGAVVGTLPYMSPEQVEGRDADARSDIFAFGVVLYELIAGTRPFTGKAPANLVASILKEEPRLLTEVVPGTPHGLADVVRTCLEKDPEKRWQSARDVRHALKLTAVVPPPPTAARSAGYWPWVAGAMAAIAVGIGAWALRPTAPPVLSRVEASVPEDVASYEYLSVSPDGRKIVVANDQRGLWLREFDAVEGRLLPGTEGASSPFWSPDSRHVGFVVDRTVKRVDTAGGPPDTLASVPSAALQSGAWNRQGDILLGSWRGGAGGPLWRASQAGGAATAMTVVDLSKGEFAHTTPTFLPDGRHFLYFRSGPADVEGMYVGSLDVAAESQSRQRILATSVPAVFASGHVLFPRTGTLMAQPFDANRLELHGVPVPVAENVAVTWFFTGLFAVSDDGVLVYKTAAPPEILQLTWVDRQGRTLGTFGSPGTDGRVVSSPDSRRGVSKDAPYNALGDLWLLDFASDRRTRFTFNRDVYSPGVWSPDGARIAYAAGRLGDTIYEKAASGLGEPQVLLEEPGLRHFPTSWSRDGRFLLYHTENATKTGYDLWALSVSDRQPYLLLGETFNEWAGVFSPDMQWVAYVSLETGASPQIFVRPFRVSPPTGQPSLGEGRWQVTRDQGNWPQWRTDREIVFNTSPAGTTVFAAAVNATGGAFEIGVPRPLPFPPSTGISTTPQSTPDGQRFLIEVAQNRRPAPTAVNVMLNWPAVLKP